MRIFFLLVSLFFLQYPLFGQTPDLSYYFSNTKTNFNQDIPTPKSVLGYEVGEWHVSHDQLVMYLKELARSSDRVSIEEFGRTYEHRPLLLLTITSPTNHQNIQKIKQERQDWVNPKAGKKLKAKDLPVILYQGYSIHGNESSGSNAALLYAYYLAAAESKEVINYLDKAVILLDPSFNPDGFNRFASWVNTHKNKNLTSDNDDREYREAYPGGRTNHYWFDLNRDWLPTQHPESQGRIRNFHEWYPNILTDHHEMGTDNTFFFQPGIPSRTNPITPKMNQVLTGKIGRFHAEALDEIGSLYYSKESFDDFYYGKGSTYPDVKGSVGILFEQASSRGHLQQSANGLLSFPFTIKNQLTTSISTLKGGVSLRKELLDYQRDFYTSSLSEIPDKGYVFGTTADRTRLKEFLELLQRHHIEIARAPRDISVDGLNFKKENSFTVSLKQPQHRLIRAIFEKTTSFPDSLFYDVSAWTLPLAFNLPYAAVDGNLLGTFIKNEKKLWTIPKKKLAKSDYAYVLEWADYLAPKVLYALQRAGLKTKVANSAFAYSINGQNKIFAAGSILIPVGNHQTMTADKLYLLMTQLQADTPCPIYSLASGETGGVNLGSPTFKALKKAKTLLLVGRGVTSYDAGEVWHLLDQRYGMDITMTEINALVPANLAKYNVIIMPNGSYGDLKIVADLKSWVKNGGTLIALRGAINWAKNNGLANVKAKQPQQKVNEQIIPYSRRAAISGAQVIGGAIFNTKADLSHPLLYGYQRDQLPVFHRGTMFLEPGKNPYATPLMYTNTPVLSGYISDKNLKLLRNSAAIRTNSLGRGRVISMVPNPVFRAFWYGTNKLLANAIFFGQTIHRSAMDGAPVVKKKK